MTGPGSTTEPTRRRSFASSGITYEQVARELGVRWCDGSDCPIDEYGGAHDEGFSNVFPGNDRAVHWRPRQMTRRGLRQFLKLASIVMYPRETYQLDFISLYRQCTLASQLAMERFGVRFPRSYADRDRARVRLWISRWQPGPLDTEFPEQRQLIRRIRAWARP